MDIRQLCLILTVTLVLLSTGFLLYLTFSQPIPQVLKLRFFNFCGQHVFTLFMLLRRRIMCLVVEEETWASLLWMIALTGGNFLAFIAMEVYCLLRDGSINSSSTHEIEKLSFFLLSYFHLYYQFNIYLGVFCLFSFAMFVVYVINQRRHRQQMQEVMDELDSSQYSAGWGDPHCSICLVEFKRSERVYRLTCGHYFHK